MGLRKYKKVAVGGTFDKLHRGHKKLIDEAFEVGEFVVIGLTTDEMLSIYTKTHPVANYDTRKRELHKYLIDKGVNGSFQIMPIEDPYGPTLSDREIEALIVSHETRNRALEINELRCLRGFKPLTIMVINMVLAEDSIAISTSRIRKDEIDREGRLLKPLRGKKQG